MLWPDTPRTMQLNSSLTPGQQPPMSPFTRFSLSIHASDTNDKSHSERTSVVPTRTLHWTRKKEEKVTYRYTLKERFVPAGYSIFGRQTRVREQCLINRWQAFTFVASVVVHFNGGRPYGSATKACCGEQHMFPTTMCVCVCVCVRARVRVCV